MLIHHTQLNKSLFQPISLLLFPFFNNGNHWSVTHWLPLVHYIQLSIHWCVTYISMAAGLPGTIPTEKSFHCVLRLITCLGSGGLNRVTVGAPSCWRGHGKCERQSLSVPLKDFTVTILHFTYIRVIGIT